MLSFPRGDRGALSGERPSGPRRQASRQRSGRPCRDRRSDGSGERPCGPGRSCARASTNVALPDERQHGPSSRRPRRSVKLVVDASVAAKWLLACRRRPRWGPLSPESPGPGHELTATPGIGARPRRPGSPDQGERQKDEGPGLGAGPFKRAMRDDRSHGSLDRPSFLRSPRVRRCAQTQERSNVGGAERRSSSATIAITGKPTARSRRVVGAPSAKPTIGTSAATRVVRTTETGWSSTGRSLKQAA